MKSRCRPILSTAAICLAAALCSCQQELPPPPLPTLEEYSCLYREQLADFRANYPEALAAFKEELVRAYAALPGQRKPHTDTVETPDIRVWKKLASTRLFRELPAKVRDDEHGCPYGIYTALWEEIAAETDTSATPENLSRRKAICNLYNHELEEEQCSMPPGVKNYIAPHLEHAGISIIPHPQRESGMAGFCRYVRTETLSPGQRELVLWYHSELARLRSNSITFSEKQDALLAEYYQRLSTLGKQ